MDITKEQQNALEGLISIYQSNIDSVRIILRDSDKDNSFAPTSLEFILRDNTELIGYQNDHVLYTYRVLKELYDKVKVQDD